MPNLPNVNLKDVFVVGLPKNSISRKEINDYLTNDLKRMKEEVYRRKMIVANQWDAETTEPQDMSQTLEASLATVQSNIEKLNAGLDEESGMIEENLHSVSKDRDIEKENNAGKNIGLYNNIVRSITSGSYDQASRTVLMNELQNLDPLLSSICLNISEMIQEILVHNNANYDAGHKNYLHFRSLTIVKLLTMLATYTLMHDNIKSQKLDLITYPKLKEYIPILVKREIRTQNGMEQVVEAFTESIPADRLDNAVSQRINKIEAETGHPLSKMERDKIASMYSTKNIFIPFIDQRMLQELSIDKEETPEIRDMTNTPNPNMSNLPAPYNRRPFRFEDVNEDELNDLFGYGKKKRTPKKTPKTHFKVDTADITHIPVAFDMHPFY